MFSSGVMIVPGRSVAEVLAAAQAAEEAGFECCLIADEGFTYDVYALMTSVVLNTKRLRVAPITNPYTRHPAVTAAALASVNALAPGRVFLAVVPGGSLVLGPMNLATKKPVTASREMIHIVRALLTGGKHDLDGEVFSIRGAELHIPAEPIEIWVMGRSPKMIGLSGEVADVTVITGHMATAAALELARDGAAISGRELRLAYLGGMAFKPAMLDLKRPHYTYVIPDSPANVWEKLGVTPQWVAELKQIREQEGIEAAAALISDDILHRAMVTGTPDECALHTHRLAQECGYSHFILPVVSLDGGYALPLIRESAQIYRKAQRLSQEEAND
jgi:5,10-methylenetetrahydromethanopterin reductase